MKLLGYTIDFNDFKTWIVIVTIVIAVYYSLSRLQEGFSVGVGDKQKTIVLYYAPWCGHCKRLMPEWKQLEKIYENHPDVEVKKVNCDDEPDKAKAEGVRGFPTIILYNKNGDKTVYRDKRTAASIKDFVDRA